MHTNAIAMPTAKLLPATLELTDGRYRLRPWADADAEPLWTAAHESRDSVGKWLPWCHAGYARSDAVAWINHCQAGWRSGGHFAFAIFDAVEGTLLGGVGLNQRDAEHHRANLGYWVRQSHQQQGIAVAASGMVARFGFDRLGLIRLEIIVMPENQPSRRVAEKLGAQHEGRLRQRLWLKGEPHDAEAYALIPQDLQQANRAPQAIHDRRTPAGS